MPQRHLHSYRTRREYGRGYERSRISRLIRGVDYLTSAEKKFIKYDKRI